MSFGSAASGWLKPTEDELAESDAIANDPEFARFYL